MKEMNAKGMEKYLTLFGDLPGITDEALQEQEAARGKFLLFFCSVSTVCLQNFRKIVNTETGYHSHKALGAKPHQKLSQIPGYELQGFTEYPRIVEQNHELTKYRRSLNISRGFFTWKEP